MTFRSKSVSGKAKRNMPRGFPVTAGDRFATRYRAWSDAVARLQAAIERIKEAPAPMGNKWQERQVAYFERQLQELRAAEPKRK